MRAIRSLLDLGKNVIVVGGGLAGLAASIYLARGGRTVTVFEKRRNLGGRAVTHLRHGFRFNLGPHAFYRGGAGSRVLHELGIPIRGGVPNGNGVAIFNNEHFAFPGNPWALLTTHLLSAGDKVESVKLLWRVRRLKNAEKYAAMSARDWLDANVSRPRVRAFFAALLRLATYSTHLELINAAAALKHLRLAIRGVIYIDEGWQKMVDGLHSLAVTAGVNFITSSRVIRVVHDGAVRAIEVGGLEEDPQDTGSVVHGGTSRVGPGTRLNADTVLLAVEPSTARELVKELSWTEMTPVKLSTLDVALSSLPNPKTTFALGIDRPLYFSVHSRWAQLTPKGGALIHTARYDGGDNEGELELLLDDLQPGWRDVVVHRRFLPSMIVSNALMPPAPATRPAPRTPIDGLYLAGDWVGEVGLLSDASLASARSAAQAILASGE